MSTTKLKYVGCVMVTLGADKEIQPNPVIVPLPLTENTIKATEKKEDVKQTGLCCGNTVAFGAKEVSGSIGGVITSDVSAIILQHIFGKFDTNIDAVTEDWATGVVVAKGNKVNHSNGDTLHCVQGGTTGGTEPTIVKRLKRITDGTAVWIARNKFKDGNITTNKELRTIAIEMKFKKSDGTFEYVLYSGIYLNKSSVNAKGDKIAMEWKADATGSSVVDSLTTVGYVPLADMAGAKTLKFEDDKYFNNELDGGFCSYLNNAPLLDYEEFTFDISRKVEAKGIATSSDSVTLTAPPLKIDDLPTITGKLKIDHTEATYLMLYYHEKFDVKIDAVGHLGGLVSYEFQDVYGGYSDIGREECTDATLESELTVPSLCDDTTATPKVRVLYPDFVDTTGATVVYPI